MAYNNIIDRFLEMTFFPLKRLLTRYLVAGMKERFSWLLEESSRVSPGQGGYENRRKKTIIVKLSCLLA